MFVHLWGRNSLPQLRYHGSKANVGLPNQHFGAVGIEIAGKRNEPMGLHTIYNKSLAVKEVLN